MILRIPFCKTVLKARHFQQWNQHWPIFFLFNTCTQTYTSNLSLQLRHRNKPWGNHPTLITVNHVSEHASQEIAKQQYHISLLLLTNILSQSALTPNFKTNGQCTFSGLKTIQIKQTLDLNVKSTTKCTFGQHRFNKPLLRNKSLALQCT